MSVRNAPNEREKIEPLYGSRALLIDAPSSSSENQRKRRYLVVSDLHIGFEERFRGAGISIESRIDSMLNELIGLIDSNSVSDLLINGDVKSGIDRISKSEWENVPKFFDKLLAHCRVAVVPGNHDGGLNHLLPNEVELLDSGGVLIGKTLVMHGHTRPSSKFEPLCDRIVIGHLHPIFQRSGSPLSGQPVWVLTRLEKSAPFAQTSGNRGVKEEGEDLQVAAGNDLAPLLEVVVMPSFNLELVVTGYAADEAKQERRLAPILRTLEKSSKEAFIITLHGDLIGDVSLLPRIL